MCYPNSSKSHTQSPFEAFLLLPTLAIFIASLAVLDVLLNIPASGVIHIDIDIYINNLLYFQF